MASAYRPQPPPPPPTDLELTIVAAKHLKNVNWRTGELKPYCVFWVDPIRRLSTKSDDAGSIRPVWNERFSLPLPPPETAHPSYLTLEVFHSKPSETPKPLVGTLRISLSDLPDPEDSDRVRSFELTRPSGRPQGKIRVKIGIRERAFPPPPHPHFQDYAFAPTSGYYYNPATTPPPPQPRDYARYSPPPYAPYPPPSHPAPTLPSFYNGYYSSPVAAAVPPPLRPMFYGGAPSAPVDAYSSYDQRQRGVDGKGAGLGTGLAVGAVAGALSGLALDEGLKYEEDKVAEKVESDFSGRDSYSNYRADY